MATDPFDNVALTQEIGQPTFVELIVAKQETGKAIRTICHDVGNEEVCDEGPSPTLRLRELAFGRRREIVGSDPCGATAGTTTQSTTQATTIQAATQAYKMGVGGSSSIEAKAAKIEEDFYDLASNPIAALITPSASTCTSNILINGTFSSGLAGWSTAGDVFWQPSTASAVLRANPSGPTPTLSQLAIVQPDKILRLDFDLIVFFEYDDWSLDVIVKDNTSTIYSATITKTDEFGTFSIGNIPPATTGIVQVEFQNTSIIGLESKLLNLDNIKLCFDDSLDTLVCDAGFNLIEKTDFSDIGRNDWETDNATVTDRLNLNVAPKSVNFGTGSSTYEYGVFFTNDQNEAGVGTPPGTQNNLTKAPYVFDLDGMTPTAIEVDDPNGVVYIALRGVTTAEIVKFNYDGSNRTDVYSEPLIFSGITSLAIDPTNNTIYFGSGSRIKRISTSSLPATTATTIYTAASGSITRLKIDFTNNRIYFIRNFSAIDSQVLRINTSGAGILTLTSSIPNARSIALDIHNGLVYVGTGEASGEVALYTLDVSGGAGGTFIKIFSTTPILPGETQTSLRSISDLDFHPNGLLYMAGGYGIWTIQPNGTGFTNIYNSNKFVGGTDVLGAIHIGYRRATVVRKLFRNLEPGSPVRLRALFDDIIAPTGQIDNRGIQLELARPEGGKITAQVTNTDNAAATYNAAASGILSANLIMAVENEASASVEAGIFELLVCGGQIGTRPQCTVVAPNELDFQDFTNNDGGWRPAIGSTLNTQQGLHEITNANGALTKVFTGITLDSLIEFHFDIVAITGGGTVNIRVIESVGGDNVIIDRDYTVASTTTVSAVTSVNTIRIEFRYTGSGSAKLDDFLLCSGQLNDCRIYNVSAELIWGGSPIRPINIFEGFLRYKLRGRLDPTAIAFVNQPILEAAHLSSDIVLFCDFWKQQGNGNQAELNPLAPTVNIGNVVEGEESDANTRNWVWSTPVSGAGNDKLIMSVNDPQTQSAGRIATGDPVCGAHINASNYDPTCVVESVSVFFHINRILTLTDLSDLCPLEGLTVRLKFKDGKGINRSFDQDVDLAGLYSIPESQIDPDIPWDNMTSLGDGISGDTARWETFTFLLDGLSGNGLNQCTTISTPTFSGAGSLNFSKFQLSGRGFIAEDCDPEVTITTEDEGSKTDEVQSIVLPHPSAGTYDITLSDKGITDTVTIPWNSDAAQVRVKLGQLNSVGGTANITVTGKGIVEDPFLVTFTGQLSARDMNLMVADATDLGGTGEGVIQTIRDGTFNEQQTVYNNSGGSQNFSISFNGSTTIDLPFNVSIIDIQNALQGIASIGAGNAIVTGNTEDLESEYEGPWIVKFQNDLGNENLPEMTINSTNSGWEVVTDWNGGGGINEIQELRIIATSGTYTLEFTHPDDPTNVQITGDIAFNASNTEVLAVIIGSIDWLNTANFNVRFIEDGPDGLIFQLIFRDTLWGIDIPQVMINTNLLKGGDIIITEVVKGGGNREKQRIKMKNVTGGTWTLTVDVPNVGEQTTASLNWNAEPEEIEAAIQALPGVAAGDVSVSGNFPVYLVVFRKTLGNIDLMEANIGLLECTGFVVIPVPPPPYEYPLNEPPDLTPPPPPPPRLPLQDSQNIYIKTNYQRYLFDPNFKQNLTLRDLALLKGVDVFLYTPYKRACDNSNLLPTTYSQMVATKDSYVLVESTIDSVLERQRILNHFKTHREILPARFTWECLET